MRINEYKELFNGHFEKILRIVCVILFLIVCFSYLVLWGFCKNNDKSDSSKISAELPFDKISLTVGLGEVHELKGNFPDSETAHIYTSSSSDIASVDRLKGTVTAKKLGTAAVTAINCKNQKVRFEITVEKAPSQISLNRTSVTIGLGEKYDLDSSLPNGEASYSIVYTSNDSSIASVSSDGGVVTAEELGTTTVTASTYNGQKVSCEITVKKAPTKISLNKRMLVLYVGEKYELKSSLPNGEASNSIAYISSDSDIAEVTKSKGEVTAKKLGTATVTATSYNGKKVKCTVAVVSGKDVEAVVDSVIKDGAGWSGKTISSFKAGTKFNQISRKGYWIQVEHNGNIGYVYNKAFGAKSNYNSINKNTLPIVIDDWFFSNGIGIKSIFDYCYKVNYSSLPKESMEDMCVRAVKMKTGACYHHAALLDYMLKRAGYTSLYVDGIDKYTGGDPHAWTMVKTSDGWRHIDATQIRGLQTFYLVKDSDMNPYFSWDRKKYPAAK